MICIPCRKAADDKQYGIEAHARAGCKAAQAEMEMDLFQHPASPEANEEYRVATSACDCQHANERLVNLDRVSPEMREEILGGK